MELQYQTFRCISPIKYKSMLEKHDLNTVLSQFIGDMVSDYMDAFRTGKLIQSFRTADRHARSISRSAGIVSGTHKLDENWFRALLAQILAMDAIHLGVDSVFENDCNAMFRDLGWPKYKEVVAPIFDKECLKPWDKLLKFPFPKLDGKTIDLLIKLVPYSDYIRGMILESAKGKKYVVFGRKSETDYICYDLENWREFVWSVATMDRMKKIDYKEMDF